MRVGASFAVATLAVALGFLRVGAQSTGTRGAGEPLGRGSPVESPTQSTAGVVALREEASPFVAFNIWVRSGSASDPTGKEGLASLTARLISSGATEQDSFVQILEKLYPLAADYVSSVDKDMTNITGRVHRDNLEAFYTLLRNAVLSPAFSEADFTRIKAQWMNYLERGRRYSRDEELSKELLAWMAYDETPYRHPVDGYVQSVRSITLDDVRGFYRSHYIRNNIIVGIGGGYPEGFVERVRRDLDALPEGRVHAPAVLSLKPLAGIRMLLVEKDTAASPVSFGYPIALLRNHPDFVPLLVANAYLGEHRNPFGRLYQAIRETRGMNYGNYSYIEAFPAGYATQQPRVNVARRSQLFEIWIRPISQTAPGNLHDRTLFALRAAMHEVDRLVNTGMTPEAVAAAKTFLRNYVGTWGSTISRRLGYAVDDSFYGIEAPGYLQTLKLAIDNVTPEQVNGAIRRQLGTNGMCVVIVTSDAAGLKAKLISGAATPITYAGERTAEVLDEDRIIAARPIPVKESDIRILKIDEVFER